jgi:uncharacterized protein (DUF488 family)
MKPQTRGMVYTIGHGRRSLDQLISLLEEHGIRRLVDIRRMPRSAANPQFNSDALVNALAARGIGYGHLAALGGFRKPRANSPNTGWHNKSFQGYADYMLTESFQQGIEHLVTAAAKEAVAILCAETVPWRCHRSLVADALVARNVPVLHIIDHRHADRHVLRDWARLEGKQLTYPANAVTETDQVELR